MEGVFIRRDYYLDLLDKNTASFKKGVAKNIALLGSRKSGKSSIVKEYIKNLKDVLPIYIDLEKISLNPENFSVEFIGNVIFNFLKKPLFDKKEFLILENLLNTERELNSKNSFLLVKSVENELLKIKPNQRFLVEAAFNFADILGRENNKKFLIVIDNFENLLDLNNFPQIKDVLTLINFDAKNVSYVVTSSAVKESLALLKNFECYEIKNFDKKETLDFVESFFGKNKIDKEKISSEIFSLSQGHPFVTAAICKKYDETKNARKAFLVELLQKDNLIHTYCKDSLGYYYNRARGQTLLKTILKVIANDELRLSEIAKKIYRSAPVTKSILERLMDVGIIYKKDNRFYFSDNVLRLWLKLISLGYEFDDIPDDKTLDEVAKEL